MAVDCGRAAYAVAGRVAKRIGHMTLAELLALEDMLEYPELFVYWDYLTNEDIDKIIAILKKSAEQK